MFTPSALTNAAFRYLVPVVATALVQLATPVSGARAQDGGTAASAHRGRRGHHADLEGIADQLGLSAEQRTRLRALRERHREARREGRGRGPGASTARDGFRDELRQILTDEQWQRAQAIFRQRGVERRAHKIERMTAQLGLNADQQARVRTVFERADTQREALHQMERGTARHQAARELRESTRAALAEILTPAQVQQLERHRGRDCGHHGRGHRGRERAQKK